MAKNLTAVYISDTGLRLIATRGRRIIKMAEAPLDANLNEIDTPEKERELTARIKTLFESNKVDAKKIILGLSGLHCLTRPLALPELPRPMLKEAVTREAKRVLPVPLEQLYISYQITSVTPGKISAFMVAIPRQIADMVMRVFTAAGCKPYLMDIKPLALARLARSGTALVVDVQSREFDIVIMINGMPQPVRTVALPQENLALEDKLNIVREDVKRTLQFFNSNNQDNQIPADTPVYVSGDLAEEPEIYEAMAAELHLKAEVLTSPLKCLKQLDPARYLANIGLVLKESPKEAVATLLPNFNTLPEPYQPKQVSVGRLMAIPATGIAVGILVLMMFVVQHAAAQISSDENKLKSNQFLLEKKQNDKKTLLQNIADTKTALTQTESDYELFSGALQSLNAAGDLVNDDIGAVVDSVVPGQIIISFSHNGHQILVNGKADSEQLVLDYVKNLTDSGRFEEITIASITLEETEQATTVVDYSLTCKLKGDRE